VTALAGVLRLAANLWPGVQMAAVTAPHARRSLLGMVGSALAARAKRKGRPSKVAALISDHLLTVAAFVTADVGFWHVMGMLPGCLAVGASLLIIDLKLQG
jgi:hypothetical protein